jgi:hypothetical protein
MAIPAGGTIPCRIASATMTNTQHHKANGVAKPSEYLSDLADLKRHMAEFEAKYSEQSGQVDQEKKNYQEPAKENFHADKPNGLTKLGLPQADEISKVNLGKDQNSRLATILKKMKRDDRNDTWGLFVLAYESGLLTPNDMAININQPLNLRVIFPWFPKQHRYAKKFDIRYRTSRELVRNDVIPVAIANKDAVMANPDLLEQLVYNERQRRVRAEQETKAIESLQPGESHIIVYGQTVWPRVNARSGSYSYEEICCAARIIRDADDNFKGEPKSRAINFRNSTKWLRRYCASVITKDADAKASIERVHSLVHWLASFLEESPKGECRWPATIHME